MFMSHDVCAKRRGVGEKERRSLERKMTKKKNNNLEVRVVRAHRVLTSLLKIDTSGENNQTELHNSKFTDKTLWARFIFVGGTEI